MDPKIEATYEELRQSDKKPAKKWPKRIAIHFVSLLWLLPIIAFLYLNFAHYILGPSVWCLGKCSVNDANGQYLAERIPQFEIRDHDTNGTLLFAAKGLEVWFTFVAGFLVFEAQKALRESKGGLPSDYSLMDLEFSDILNLIKISKWTRPIRNLPRAPKYRRQVSKLCAFLLLAFLMTVLVNLMGPATGVLILPTLQSIKQHQEPGERFVQMQSDTQLTSESGFLLCTALELEHSQYGCAESVQGLELDSMLSSIIGPIRKIIYSPEDWTVQLAESQEGGVKFLAYNFTAPTKKDNGKKINAKDTGEQYSIPNRQTLRVLAQDINDTIHDKYGDDLVSPNISNISIHLSISLDV